MSDVTDEITVSRNEGESRYEIRVGDDLAGFTEFVATRDGKLVFPHTLIDPTFEGRGLATRLVAAAMTDVAAQDGTVVPLCPVVAHYLRKNEVPGLTVEFRGDAA